MTTNEEIHEALLVINSRLETIDGKVNLLARAEREQLREALRKIILGHPIIGHIYVLLDGTRNQEELTVAVQGRGVPTSKSSVSRWLNDMHREHGIVERVPHTGAGKLYRKNDAFEHALNLTKWVEQWLEEADDDGKTGKRAK